MPRDEAETIYAIRLAGGVSQTIATEYERMEGLSGPDVADRWRDGMLDTIQSLATLPERCVVANENPLYQAVRGPTATVRQIIFQRGGAGPPGACCSPFMKPTRMTRPPSGYGTFATARRLR